MIALALLLQAAPATPVTRVTAAPPERFSILISECPPPAGTDVVVCGTTIEGSQRVPLPNDYIPNRPVPSNPLMNGVGALRAENTVCAAKVGGCQVGVGPPLMPMIAAAARGIGDAIADRREGRARRADGDRRQPIDLGGTAPAGRLER